MSEKNWTDGFKRFFFCLVLPIGLTYFASFWFVSKYTVWGFSAEGFHRQYDSGIYRYRILGKFLVRQACRVVDVLGLETGDARLLAFFQTDSLRYYHAHVLVNLLFFVLFAHVFHALLQRPEYAGVPSRERDLWQVVFLLLVGLSLSVVTPYDLPALFFQACALYLMFLPTSTITVLLQSLIMILATLTRESSALILSTFVVFVLARSTGSRRRETAALLLLTIIYLSVYVGLRVVLGWENGTFEYRIPGPWIRHIIPLSLIAGFGGWLVDWQAPEKRRRSALFLLACSPYFWSIAQQGILAELRLWIPVFLPLLLINRLSPAVQTMNVESS